MADLSSVSGLSSLSTDLYYQYLINNNSTSTMLNALSGTDSEELGAGSILDTVTSGSLASLSGLGSVYGSDEDLLSASQGLSNFSSILETYMSAQKLEAAEMTEKLSGVLEEAAQIEDTSSLTYRTVQEIYEYFQGKTASAAGTTVGGVTTSSQVSPTEVQTEPMVPENVTEMDFESLEQQIQESIESSLPYSFSM